MRRVIIIIIIVVLLGAAVGLFFYFRSLRQQTPGPAGPPAVLPPPAITTSTSGIPQGDTIRIQSSRGTVEVKNFYKDAQAISSALVILPAGAKYYLDYQRADGSFLIQLLVHEKAEAEQVRHEAEQQLLSLLGISKEQACLLDARVIVPSARDLGFSDINYGLSFCAGSVSF